MKEIHSISEFIKKNILILVLFLIASFGVFSNSLLNEFSVVDDLSGFIENDTIKSIPKSLQSFKIQEIIYSISYHFFKINPVPLRILAICNHAIVAFLLFLILYKLFNKKFALLAASLFIAHPVTTEALNWISGQFYIVMAGIIYASLLCLQFYRSTSKQKYIYYIIGLFSFDIIFIRHAWVLVVPFAVITFDYFFLEAKKNQQFYKQYLSWIIALTALFVIFNFSGQFTQRMLSRNESGKTLQNEQTLIPVIQGYPYTIFNMMRLYLFPKELTIYYDGNKITSTTQLLMYGVFIMYLGATIYVFKRNKRYAGILIMMLILILPVLSPKKITWFITERYLYAGTGFFVALLMSGIFYIETKLKNKYVTFVIAGVIFILYAGRTFVRNQDWRNPKTLALATIKTSPYSVRPYNDIAGYYVLQHDYSTAKKYYVDALKVSPSLTAIHNLGHIYLETDFDPSIRTVNQPADNIYNEVIRMLQNQDYFAAAYYLNEVIAQEPLHTEALHRIAELYVSYQRPDKAQKYVDFITTNKLEKTETYIIQAQIYASELKLNEAIQSLNICLKIDPHNVQCLQMLRQIQASTN